MTNSNAPLKTIAVNDIFKHVKRGTTYKVLSIKVIMFSHKKSVKDGDLLPVFYRYDATKNYFSLYYNVVFIKNFGTARYTFKNNFFYLYINGKHSRKKIDEFYDYFGTAAIQSENPIDETITIVLYEDLNDGSLWIRPLTEFTDGRFIIADNAHSTE